MGALAEDHINDVMSNLGALVAAAVAKAWPQGWWVDAAAAILIAAVILVRWSFVTHAQVGGAALGWCMAGRVPAAPQACVRARPRAALPHPPPLPCPPRSVGRLQGSLSPPSATQP